MMSHAVYMLLLKIIGNTAPSRLNRGIKDDFMVDISKAKDCDNHNLS